MAKYKANPDGSNWTLREREIAYGLSAIFKDCSIIVRSVLTRDGDGWKLDEAKSSVKLIDVDLKPLKLAHWAQLDDKLWRHWAETKGSPDVKSQFLAVGGSGIPRDTTFGSGSELPVEVPPSPSGSIPDVNSATEELARMTQDDGNSNLSPVPHSAAVMPVPLQVPVPREVKSVETPAVAESEAASAPTEAAEAKADASDAFADAPGDVAPVETKGPSPVFTPAVLPPVAKSSSRAASTKAPSVKAPSVKAPSVVEKEKTPVAEPVALPVEETPVAKVESAETSEAAPIESPESDVTAKAVEAPANDSAPSPQAAEPVPPSVEVTAPAAEAAAPAAAVTAAAAATATAAAAAKANTPPKTDSQLPTPTQSPVKVARKKSSVFTSLKSKLSGKFDDKDKASKKSTSPKKDLKKLEPETTGRGKKAAAGAAVGMGAVAAGIAAYESKAKKVAEEIKAESDRRVSREFVRDRSVSVDLAKRKSLFEDPAAAAAAPETGTSPDTSLSTGASPDTSLETVPDEPIATPAGETTDPVIAAEHTEPQPETQPEADAEPERRKPAAIERTWENQDGEEDVPETPRALPPAIKVPALSPAAADDSPLTPGITQLPSPPVPPVVVAPETESVTEGEDDRGRRSDAPSPALAPVAPSLGQSVDVPTPIATIPLPTTPEIEHSSPLRASLPQDVKRYSLTELPPLPDGTPGSRRVSRSFEPEVLGHDVAAGHGVQEHAHVGSDAPAHGQAAHANIHEGPGHDETASVISSIDHRGFDTAPDTPQLDQDEFASQQHFSRGGMASTSTFGGHAEHTEMRRKRVSLNESEAMSEAAWLGSPVTSTRVLPEEPEP